MVLIQIRSPIKHHIKCFVVASSRHCWLVHSQIWCRKKRGVRAESEATFPLSRSRKMMRPICSMPRETVPCRLTDFKAVRLCSTISHFGSCRWAFFFFFWSTDSNSPSHPGFESLPKALTDLQQHAVFSRCIYFGQQLYLRSISPSVKQIIMCYISILHFGFRIISWVLHIYHIFIFNNGSHF